MLSVNTPCLGLKQSRTIPRKVDMVVNFDLPVKRDSLDEPDIDLYLLRLLEKVVPTDYVALGNPTKNLDDYLVINLQVFPFGDERFNRTGILGLGFSLSNQTFKPPAAFGTYFFIGENYGFLTDCDCCWTICFSSKKGELKEPPMRASLLHYGMQIMKVVPSLS
uniref:Probable leucine-rich repeat receptor-like protein kinase At5g49770 n=1 Tax=Tanacetum cinerariifolium TaxID=118510 RepID=A0A6L2L5X1_TANCI|nr:probable leucine-rich repeat receptor-like protein kinase At5g49770 [Tanacetum cinerariifolium]